MNSVAKNITYIRIKEKMTREQLAEKLGVSRLTVTDWERGTAFPGLITLGSIASFFGVDTTELMYGDLKEQESAKKRCRKRIIAACLFTAVTAALILLEIIFVPYFKEQARTYYQMMPIWIIAYAVQPVLYTCAPLAFLSFLSLWSDIRTVRRGARAAALLAGILILALYALVALLLFNILPPGQFFYPAAYRLCTVFVTQPVLFFIPGTLLFFGFNKNR